MNKISFLIVVCCLAGACSRHADQSQPVDSSEQLKPGAAAESADTTSIDGLEVSPDNFKLLLENERVRVFEYSIKPGQKDNPHTHPPKVYYVLSGGMLRVYPDGEEPFDAEEKTGTAEWSDRVGKHFVENIGNTTVRLLVTEVKQSGIHDAITGQLDPVVLSPDNYTVILENEHVRVVEYAIKPGETEKTHTHPAKTMYALSGGSIRLHLDGQTPIEEGIVEGMAEWSDPVGKHYGENTGKTTVRILMTEIK